MGSPGPTPDFGADEAARAFREALQELSRHARGGQVVARSLDIPVGLTPRQTVWALNKARLYRYAPATGTRRRAVPLLLVYALINKPYIFDLRPGRSFVEYLVAEGFEVYLLDWGAPGLEDRHLRFDAYAAEYLPRAVRKVLRLSGAAEVSVLGYCIGATIAAMYAALHPEAPLRNLVLLTPPLDFSQRDDSLFAKWFDERWFDVDRLVAALGNVPAELIETFSKMLKPVENYVGTYTSLRGKLDDDVAVDGWQALHRWVHDGVPMTGAAFRQWVVDFVRGNRLVKGELEVGGRRVDLGNVRAPLLAVIAEHDHIVPPSQSRCVMDLVGSRDKRLETIAAGHVGVMVGRGAQKGLWPLIAEWLGERERHRA